ncbi:hypothetical protein SNEBB_007881 [Seison nebaliae]|nr:hypothetical protein SNEBB_007881 [Seison nebaliae]
MNVLRWKMNVCPLQHLLIFIKLFWLVIFVYCLVSEWQYMSEVKQFQVKSNLLIDSKDLVYSKIFQNYSVKFRLMDPIGQYIETPIGESIAKVIYRYFPNITPNQVSFTAIPICIVSFFLLVHPTNFHLVILGISIMELQNIFDCVDGSLYRLKSHNHYYISIRNRLSWYIDACCDIVTGITLFLVILIITRKNNGMKMRRYIWLKLISFFYSFKQITKFLWKNFIRHLSNSSTHSNDMNEKKEWIDNESFDDSDENYNTNKSPPISQKRTMSTFLIFSFGARFLLLAYVCDQILQEYTRLLHSNDPFRSELSIIDRDDNSEQSVNQTIFDSSQMDSLLKRMRRETEILKNVRSYQISVFKSWTTFILTSLWRLTYPLFIKDQLLIAISLKSLKKYIYFTNSLGWIYLILLLILSKLHFIHITNNIHQLLLNNQQPTDNLLK